MYKTLYTSEKVLVRQHMQSWETYKVTVTQDSGVKRTRTFRGETAWMDAERYASDHDMAAWGCTQVIRVGAVQPGVRG